MSEPELLPPPSDSHLRWKFLRDVLVFQLKLILGNLQNFVLVPVSLVAAVFDLFFRGQREGGKFYKVMDWGRRTDEMINVYSAIGGYHATGDENEKDMYGNYTVDAVLARVENVIVREYQKGGTAANIKGAVDRAIDGMQAHGEKHADKIDEAFQRTDGAIRRATDKFKNKSGGGSPEENV